MVIIYNGIVYKRKRMIECDKWHSVGKINVWHLSKIDMTMKEKKNTIMNFEMKKKIELTDLVELVHIYKCNLRMIHQSM